MIKEYELDPSTQDVIGHALCLYTSSDWQQEKVGEWRAESGERLCRFRF
jgi:hypothetical protein